MQSHILEVVVDPTIKHSFVLVSRKFFDSVLLPLFHGHPPPVIPLRVEGSGGTTFVGCLTREFHHHLGQRIVFPSCLANNCHINEKETIQCIPVLKLPQASKVLVSPTSVDESEVVEKNALEIESSLLRQLYVVAPEMIVTVFLSSGMTAKLKVCEIEAGEGNPVEKGGAVMMEGTMFIIATRPRESPTSSRNDTEAPPRWAVLRSIPNPELREEKNGSLLEIIEMNPLTAARWNWKEGRFLGLHDLASLAELKVKADLSSSFFRTQLSVKLRISSNVPSDVCYTSLPKVTNVLLIPSEGGPSATSVESQSTAHVKPSNSPSWEQVCAIHGDVPKHLLRCVRATLQSPLALIGKNALLCGGKGFGKTTVVSAVLEQLKDVRVVTVKCNPNKEFVSNLEKAMMEAILCAPSVLFLDDFDLVAPSQKENNVASISNMTIAKLHAVLWQLSSMQSLVEKNQVAIVATCHSRESLHEHFRTPALFPSCYALSPLSRATRETLLTQCIPSIEIADARKMVAFMENYCPFDVYRFSQRLISVTNLEGSIVERTRKLTESFTPLAHTGINFFKGEKVDWDSIGGLKDAKKILYDTLVLPIKHPKLFSKLPLKTRSGILLYGPSGSGKTYVMESLVKAENLNCLVVNGPEVFGKYIGESEQKIRDIFERAQAAAPCVVFFDEFDSVAPQRGLDNSGVTDRVVNQLLCYLDGVEGRKDVFVVAASSRPDLIDAALLRPGRLDKAVACPIPSTTDRFEILHSLLSKIQSSVTNEDIQQLVEATPNWTPADLAALVSSANTIACEKVVDSALVSSPSTDSVNAEMYCITDVGSGQSIDRIKDSLNILIKNEETRRAELKIVVTTEDIFDALKTTRPSLTARDIQKFNRIHRLFCKGETVLPQRPGTKLTSN